MQFRETPHAKNFIIFGPPQCGKTTILEKLCELFDEAEIPIHYTGFIGKEIRTAVVRQGFLIRPVGDASQFLRPFVLAHMNYTNSPFTVAKYGVDVETFDKSIPKLIKFTDETEKSKMKKVVIIDEIGAMTCFSKNFKQELQRVLDDPNRIVMASVSQAPFLQELDGRNDTRVIQLDYRLVIREDIPGLLFECARNQIPEANIDEEREDEEVEQEDPLKKLESLTTSQSTGPYLNTSLVGPGAGRGHAGAGAGVGRGFRRGRGFGRRGRGRGFRQGLNLSGQAGGFGLGTAQT
jgi:nucleoside-triphosphatase THEP1